MKAIKVMGTVNESGQIALDSPLNIEKTSRVEVIVLIPEETELIAENTTKKAILEDFSKAWHEAMNGEIIPIEQLWES